LLKDEKLFRDKLISIYVYKKMSQKHFVIDMDYLNDLACNIAENVPEKYHKKFLIELSDYMKCASFEFESSDAEDSESGSEDYVDEEYEVSKNEEGFYELTECDVKDCNAVGKEEKKYPK
jgi:predicted house-cleaning noncanonical NTP pyrophosphatase (MazG superfamily)